MYLQKEKSKKTLKKIIFCYHLEGHLRKYQDPEPDPLVRGMDPRIRFRVRAKMSRIRNTGRSYFYYGHLFDGVEAPLPTLALVTTLEVEGRLVVAAADSAVGKKISARCDSMVRSVRTSRSPFLVAATLALVFTLATRPCLRALPPPTRASREMLSFREGFEFLFREILPGFFYHVNFCKI
jgi:hypothetical protein